MNARPLMVAGIVAGLLVGGSTAAQAQVGSTPENSPFRDVEKRQGISLIVGPSFGGKDKVGAAPRGGLGIGVRYDVPLGASPLAFTSSLVRQSSSRDVLQPGLPLANRVGATVSEPLWFLDAALTLMLTGRKSWHSLMPSISLGAGIANDTKAITDSSLFQFGSRFAPNVGLGFKYAPLKSRWTLRADMTNRFYSVPYPATFRDSTPNIPRLVGPNTKNSWTRNTMLTIGLVREIGRR